ncbi:MAG: Hpt domain-containing protein [Pseudolabrys sp.]|nr:Hpt domain-containing protein [Pseudolabrys sp.]
MARRRKNTAAIATYHDHEVIMPENRLRKAIAARPAASGEEDPVARAEKALAALSDQFAAWMDEECKRLDGARRALIAHGLNATRVQTLFRAAHDIKGEAATFGFPALAAVAESLCRLIELTPSVTRIPLRLVDQHVDAIRAIYREYARADAAALADRLTDRLREVTDDFLLRENRGRDEVIARIKAPTLVPES